MDWRVVFHHYHAMLNFKVLTAQVADGKPAWCMFQVTDKHRKDQVVFEAFFPNLLPNNDRNQSWSMLMEDDPRARIILDLMLIVWLLTPSVYRDQKQLEFIWGFIDPKYHRFTQLLLTKYFAVAKYERGYDYGIPCATYDTALFDPTLWPKSRQPPDFQSSSNLLSFSGGKESVMAKLVLDFLEIPHDQFRIMDWTSKPLRATTHAEHLVDTNPGYDCYLGEMRHLWPVVYLERLYSRGIPDEEVLDPGLSLSWNFALSQRLLALFYCVVKDYKTLWVGDEFERHQAYRVPDGLFLSHDFHQTQFFNNYWNYTCDLPVEIVTPINNFTQGTISHVLFENHIPFNSCYYTHQRKTWCGECAKCHRIGYLLLKHGELFHNDPLVHSNWFPELNLKRLWKTAIPKLSSYVGGYNPRNGNTIFPITSQMYNSYDRYFQQMYSSMYHNVWEFVIVDKLRKKFDLELTIDHDMNPVQFLRGSNR